MKVYKSLNDDGWQISAKYDANCIKIEPQFTHDDIGEFPPMWFSREQLLAMIDQIDAQG